MVYAGSVPPSILDGVRIAQAELRRMHNAVRLGRVPRANDGAGHGGVPERPRDRHLAGRTAVALSDGAKPLDQGEVLVKFGSLNSGLRAAPVISGKIRRALTRHGAGQ